MASAFTDVATIGASSVTSNDTTAAPSAGSSSNFVMAMSNPAYLQEATTLAAASTVNWRSSPTPRAYLRKPYPTVPFTSIEHQLALPWLQVHFAASPSYYGVGDGCTYSLFDERVRAVAAAVFLAVLDRRR